MAALHGDSYTYKFNLSTKNTPQVSVSDPHPLDAGINGMEYMHIGSSLTGEFLVTCLYTANLKGKVYLIYS